MAADSDVRTCCAPGCQRTDTRIVYLADPNDALVLCPDHDPGNAPVTLGRNQFDLLRGALEGLLKLLVDDWEADAPIAKNPWSTDERFGPLVQPQEVWNAVDQARGVLGASSKWPESGLGASNTAETHPIRKEGR